MRPCVCCSHARQESASEVTIKRWKLQQRKCTHFILVWKLSGAVYRMIWIICHCGDWRLYQLAGHLMLLCCRETRWSMCQDIQYITGTEFKKTKPRHINIRQLGGVVPVGERQGNKQHYHCDKQEAVKWNKEDIEDQSSLHTVAAALLWCHEPKSWQSTRLSTHTL